MPLIFTAGLDKMAYIWDLGNEAEGRKEPGLRGKLLQGYMMKGRDYRWDFGYLLKNHNSNASHDERRNEAYE